MSQTAKEIILWIWCMSMDVLPEIILGSKKKHKY